MALRCDLPPFSLEILDGNLVDQAVDAIVNAANNELWMGSGVAGAIKARGGSQIEAEAMSRGPIEPGQAVVTSGGQLPARHVIHAAVMGQDLQTSAAFIDRATRSALAVAEDYGLQSIALPAFGTGVGGFPLDACARIMIEAVRAAAPTARRLREVRFVLFGRPAYEAFERAALAMIGTSDHGKVRSRSTH